MTPTERKSLATKAAHARWKKDPDGIAIATHQGDAKLAGVAIDCAVLKDGRRVFSERALCRALSHNRSGGEYKRRALAEEEERLPVFLSETIAAYLSPAAREQLTRPVRYRQKDEFAMPTWGVEAELLPEICEAYLAAREAGALRTPAAARKAMAAEKLVRALAKVGVVALVDEATGFQFERDKEELQKLLEKYVSEEFRPWTRVFPNDFYVELFRLRGVTIEDVRKRPAYVGNLTNNIVYERLLPGTLARLKAVNPPNINGSRARRHHQHLTQDAGAVHLREYITGLVFLMRASVNWEGFIKALDRVSPRRTATLTLPFPDGK